MKIVHIFYEVVRTTETDSLFPCPSSRQVESKIGLDDIEFSAATPGTSYTTVHGGIFIKRLDFSFYFRQCLPPGSNESV
jgi:hypothetical protein